MEKDCEDTEKPIVGRLFGMRVALILAFLCALPVVAQQDPVAAITSELRGLRSVPDAERGAATRKIALEIRALPSANSRKLSLANSLANLSTEGDFGAGTLQEVATTLADALREQPAAQSSPYLELASLARYEGVKVKLDSPQFAAAMKQLEDQDKARANADFTLNDINGKPWHLRDLRGKVVLVNFWATWCPPCRKEMPDLDALYKEFRSQGLLVLAISDEDATKVKPFLEQHPVTYPVLLDPGRKVNGEYFVEGIPKSFVYDRDGKLAAQAIDMRTRAQFLEMLKRAGLPVSE